VDSRFRKELATIPAVQIKVSKHGFITTIGWGGDAQGTPPIGRSTLKFFIPKSRSTHMPMLLRKSNSGPCVINRCHAKFAEYKAAILTFLREEVPRK
jgi:hypothetical protein